MSETSELTIYTDGGSRGNPGPAAYAFVIQRPGADDIEEKVYLGRTTNNIAEYTGLIKALEHARHLGASCVTIYSDSELMVRQMNGDYRVKNPGLIPLHREASQLVAEFATVAIRHIRREFNKHADRLCNEALDHPADAEPFPIPLPPQDKSARANAGPPTSKDQATRTNAAPPQDAIRLRAVEILQNSAQQWALGDASSPSPELIWGRLWLMLVEAGAVRTPRKKNPGKGP